MNLEESQTKEVELSKPLRVVKTIFNLLIGIGGAVVIYNEFLFCETCNDVAVAYFCIISLSGFINLGLPVGKSLGLDL